MGWGCQWFGRGCADWWAQTIGGYWWGEKGRARQGSWAGGAAKGCFLFLFVARGYWERKGGGAFCSVYFLFYFLFLKEAREPTTQGKGVVS